jgi:hypothetical protein
MKITNSTKIDTDLIRTIAEAMGVDFKDVGEISIRDMKTTNGNNGECYSMTDGGGTFHLIKLAPWADMETLAHELRHVAQAQVLGPELCGALYEIEEELEGYEGNVFELDARAEAKDWAA